MKKQKGVFFMKHRLYNFLRLVEFHFMPTEINS